MTGKSSADLGTSERTATSSDNTRKIALRSFKGEDEEHLEIIVLRGELQNARSRAEAAEKRAKALERHLKKERSRVVRDRSDAVRYLPFLTAFCLSASRFVIVTRHHLRVRFRLCRLPSLMPLLFSMAPAVSSDSLPLPSRRTIERMQNVLMEAGEAVVHSDIAMLEDRSINAPGPYSHAAHRAEVLMRLARIEDTIQHRLRPAVQAAKRLRRENERLRGQLKERPSAALLAEERRRNEALTAAVTAQVRLIFTCIESTQLFPIGFLLVSFFNEVSSSIPPTTLLELRFRKARRRFDREQRLRERRLDAAATAAAAAAAAGVPVVGNASFWAEGGRGMGHSEKEHAKPTNDEEKRDDSGTWDTRSVETKTVDSSDIFHGAVGHGVVKEDDGEIEIEAVEIGGVEMEQPQKDKDGGVEADKRCESNKHKGEGGGVRVDRRSRSRRMMFRDRVLQGVDLHSAMNTIEETTIATYV